MTDDPRLAKLAETVSRMPAQRQAKFFQWLRLTAELIDDIKPIDLAAARERRGKVSR